MASVLAILYITVLDFFQFSIIIATCPKVLANFFTKYLNAIKPKLLIKDKAEITR